MTMKKLLSMLLTVIMVLAMAAPSFAAMDTTGGMGTISIDNAAEGKNYDVYQIFTVAYNADDTDSFTYTIAEDDEWYEVVAKYDGISLVDSKSKTAGGKIVYYVKEQEGFNAGTFANLLKANINGKEKAATLTKSNPQASVKLGYYFVNTNSGALCNLTTTAPSAPIHDKNEEPTIDKKIDNESRSGYQIGDPISYTITGKVPDLTGYTKYQYQVTDTMSKGLSFPADSTVSVKIGSYTHTVTDNELIIDTVKDAAQNNVPHFVLTLDLVALSKDDNGDVRFGFGEQIEIKYSATVNEQAAGAVIDNKATLNYSNDPSASDGGTLVPGTPVVEKTYSTQIEINKYAYDENETDGEGVALTGAKFYLYNAQGQAYQAKIENGKTTINWLAPNQDGIFDSENMPTEKTTGIDGKVNFTGLKAGTYYLEEIEAPTGYNRLVDKVEVTISEVNVDADNFAVASLTQTAKVANHAGTMLPSTGGIGTTIFYAAGIILMAGAVFFVVRKKRA